MVTLLLDRTQLEVVLSPIERAAAFHRDNLRIDRDSIVKVQLTDDAWTWVRGVASPGTHIPGVLAAGTWKSATGEDFVFIRRRRPSVIIDLENSEYDRLIFTTRHGLALTQALRFDVADAPATDVVDIVATGAIPLPVSKRKKTTPVVRPA